MEWDWQGLLGQINEAVFTSPYWSYLNLPAAAIETHWLGAPPATDAQISALETRLNTTLPPSYKAFLRVSNGWLACSPYIDVVYSTERVSLLKDSSPELVDEWDEFAEELEELDEDYPEAHMAHAIQISAWNENSLLMLNPMTQTPDGEWEAWFLASGSTNVDVYPSFWDLMTDQLKLQRDANRTAPQSAAQLAAPTNKLLRTLIKQIASARSGVMPSAPGMDTYQAELTALETILREMDTLPEAELRAGLAAMEQDLRRPKRTMMGSDAIFQLDIFNTVNKSMSDVMSQAMRQMARNDVAEFIRVVLA